MNPFFVEYLFYLCSTFILGTIVGSWLNVCVHRLGTEERFWPALKSLVYPPSHCPRCQTAIAWHDNIPIVGWLLLRGRCRNCRGSISARYPLVELLTGLLFALLYWCEIPPEWHASGGVLEHPYGPATLVSPSLTVVHLRYALHLCLLCALLVATFIDIDLRIIPDSVTLPAMITAVAVQTFTGVTFLVPVWYQTRQMARVFRSFALPFSGGPGRQNWFDELSWSDGYPPWILEHPHWHGLACSLAGLILGGGVIWGVRLVGGRVLKREAMGFGDVILMAMIGSFVGWQGTIAVFMLAPLLAVVCTVIPWVFWKPRSIPYGPYLSLATLVLLVGFRQIWPGLETGILALGPLLPVAAAVMFILLAIMLAIWLEIKRQMGWLEPELPEFVEEWLPGDQLAYLAGESVNNQQGQWRQDGWPGQLSGRGQLQAETWRHGSSAGGTWNRR